MQIIIFFLLNLAPMDAVASPRSIGPLVEPFRTFNDDGSQSMQGYCNVYDSGERITCRLRQVLVLPPMRIPGRSFKTEDAGALGDSMCNSGPLVAERLKNPRTGPVLHKELEAMARFCATKDLEALNQAFSEVDDKTCPLIVTQDFDVKFKRVAKDKWISRFENAGECGVSGILELEKPIPGSLFYNLTEIRKSFRPRPDQGIRSPSVDPCPILEREKKVRWRWDNPQKTELSCSVLWLF